MEVILSSLSSTSPRPCSFWTCFLEKKMTDDILIHISLYAILRVVRVNLFLAPWCSLIWGIFWSWELEEVWHKRIFLVIKRAGTDTTFWAAAVSKQSKQVKPSQDATPPPPPPLNMSFIPHRDVQFTSFDWEPANPISLTQATKAQTGIHLRCRSKTGVNEQKKNTKNK